MFFKNVTLLEDAVKEGIIPSFETFETPYDTNKAQSGAIRIVFPEFTCVCPKTGYPDFGEFQLVYLPGKKCVELKSWKLFLNSFRMVGTFHETVTSYIFETFKNEIEPQWAMIIGNFFPRGNVDTTVVFETDTPRPRGVDLLLYSPKPECKGFSH